VSRSPDLVCRGDQAAECQLYLLFIFHTR
jgi:hypothetical protein